MTFKRWLKQFTNEQSPKGDLARDNEQDPGFPNTYSYQKIKAHLEKQNASQLCMESFENAWSLYKEQK